MDLSPAEWTFFAVAVDLFCRVGGLFEAEYPPSNLSEAIFKMGREIEREGGKFSGTVEFGTFSGKSPLGFIKGNYQVAGNEVIITITEKPALVLQSTIIKKVREYFGL